MRVLILALGLVALTGCVPSNPGPPTPTPTTTVTTSPSPSPSPSPSHTPTPTPSPTTFASFPATLPTEDPVTAAVIAGWQEYWRVYEKYAADPGGFKDFGETRTVATGQEGEMVIASLGNLKEMGIKVIGPQQFRDVTVSKVDVRTDGVSEATISYCVDGSRLQRLDAETGELTADDVPATFLERARMELGMDQVWRVAQIRNEEATC